MLNSSAMNGICCLQSPFGLSPVGRIAGESCWTFLPAGLSGNFVAKLCLIDLLPDFRVLRGADGAPAQTEARSAYSDERGVVRRLSISRARRTKRARCVRNKISQRLLTTTPTRLRSEIQHKSSPVTHEFGPRPRRSDAWAARKLLSKGRNAFWFLYDDRSAPHHGR
jgi:hypothetical protein